MRRALDLAARLDRGANGSLAEFFPLFGGLSSRIAARIVADTTEHGTTPVRLFAGTEPDLAVRVSARESFRRLVPAGVSPRLLPLVDWRAVVMPPPPDETFAFVPGDGDALASISRVAQELPAGQHADAAHERPPAQAREDALAPNRSVRRDRSSLVRPRR